MKRDPGLFRALGYLSARGSITEYHRRDRNTTVRRVRVAVDPEALEGLRRDLSALDIAHQTEPRALKIDSKTVADGLLRLGLPLGPRRETGPKVPDAVHRAPTHLKAAYLSGLFDARASIVDDSPTTPRITLTATTPARHRDRLTAFLRDVRTLLHDLRIPATPTQPSGRDYLPPTTNASAARPTASAPASSAASNASEPAPDPPTPHPSPSYTTPASPNDRRRTSAAEASYRSTSTTTRPHSSPACSATPSATAASTRSTDDRG